MYDSLEVHVDIKAKCSILKGYKWILHRFQQVEQ